MVRPRNRQSIVAFGLSFLDVLCCGLGSAVLLLLIVKHGPAEPEIVYVPDMPLNITAIQDEIKTKTAEKTELQRVATDIQASLSDNAAAHAANESVNELQRAQLNRLLSQLHQQREELFQAQTKLSAANAMAQRAAQRSPVDATGTHLTGLKVDDQRVVILLDASASMLAASLVEIVRYRASPPAVQQSSPKWLSARGAALWVLDKIPDQASYQLLTFSDSIRNAKGTLLPPKAAPGWLRKNDPDFTPQQLEAELDQRQAFGPTDLKSALDAAAAMRPKPRQIVLVTDGLPTVPGTTRLQRIKNCPIPQPGRTPILGPMCRLEIMRDTVSKTRQKLRGLRIDVILLPLEGDSNAVEAYWNLANERGGRLLSPVPGWPIT